MANEEHLKILKQGVEAWNAWRKDNLKTPRDLLVSDIRPIAANPQDTELLNDDPNRPDFSGVDLSGKDLRSADFSDANFLCANLNGAKFNLANLESAFFCGAQLRDCLLANSIIRDTHFSKADLQNSDFRETQLSWPDLWGANLRDSKMVGARLEGAHLGEADLRGALMWRTILVECALGEADFSGAILGRTVFGRCDLSLAKGLEGASHRGPSIIGSDVLQMSQGKIPKDFLKGCGLSDWEIEAAKLHNPNLTQDERTNIWYEIERLQGEQPIQLNPLFISYSSKDAPFVEALEPRFDQRGIRYWRDIHDLKAGRLETQIDRAIRLNPTVLLVLSKDSVESDWVEWEVGQARKLEKELKRDVLCPVALDDAWKTCSWPGPLRRQIEDYHILDFSAWEDEGSFEGRFGKLLEGLKLFYRGEASK